MQLGVVSETDGLNGAVFLAFEKWALGSDKHAQVYRDLPDSIKEIALDAFTEMDHLKPGTYDIWWSLYHNRYIRKPEVKQKDLSRLHVIMYLFLTKLSRGDLIIKEKEHARPKQNNKKGKSKRSFKSAVNS